MITNRKWFRILNMAVIVILVLMALIFQWAKDFDRASMCLLWAMMSRLSLIENPPNA
jgi:hypothetical protein